MEKRIAIRPVQARLTHDCDTFTKMDPYIIFKIGAQTMKTSVHNRGGLQPRWSDTIYMSVPPQNSHISFSVMDKDTFTKDDLVGQGSISLAKVLQIGKTNDWYEIKYCGRFAGQVNILLEIVGHTPNTAFQHPTTAYQQNNPFGNGMTGMAAGYNSPSPVNNFGMPSDPRSNRNDIMRMTMPTQNTAYELPQNFANQMGSPNQLNQNQFGSPNTYPRNLGSLAASPGGFNINNLFAGMAAATLTAQGMYGINNNMGAYQSPVNQNINQGFNGNASYPTPPSNQTGQPNPAKGMENRKLAEALLMMGKLSPGLANLVKQQSTGGAQGPTAGDLPPGFLDASPSNGMGFNGFR